jgi:putative endonuclease
MVQWSSLNPRRLKKLLKPQAVEDSSDTCAGDGALERAPHLVLGERGERLAAQHLERLGYALVASNFTLPVGRNLRGAIVHAEIDLIAYDGSTLCFVEVKTRASDWFAAPEANVDLRKQRQISRAARRYRRMFDLMKEPYRYDVVSVVLPEEVVAGETARPRLEVLRSFWTDEKFRKRRWVGAYYDY